MMAVFNSTVIYAYSPHVKGRVERLFGILQDLVVKELRLKGKSSIEEANRYLPEYFKRHNAQFAVIAEKAVDMHQPAPAATKLREILCIKTERTVKNDKTVSCNGKLYQIHEALQSKKIVLEDRLDGKRLIKHNDASIGFHDIMATPEKGQQPIRLPKRRKSIPMPSDHPYRKTRDLMFKKRQLRKQLQNAAT